MAKTYGDNWKDKDKPNTQFERFYKAGVKNFAKHNQPFISTYSRSGSDKAEYISSIHKPTDLASTYWE